ncbi:peroxiredoxin [Natronoflexus pectinivorans]|uniref:Peroxiredoxin n=1 Tax=Natronoflexus pectinivorans TaxID=682526 RepID=A0A4R2GDB1_9BACT|nr:TlpA disulfide reductase family protein [Natronoflexus pectinivorans]TCO06026.1 peroxiredoxin [Natronoflexus pectinivorans]
MRNLVIAFALGVLLSCSSPSNNDEINILAKGLDDGVVLYLYSRNLQQNIDSGYIVNGKLQFIVENSSPEVFLLHNGFQNQNDFLYIDFWKEGNSVEIVIENERFREALVTGSEIQNQKAQLDSYTNPYMAKIDSLWNVFDSLPYDDVEQRTAISETIRDLHNRTNEISLEFIRSNPSYLYSAYMLNSYMAGYPNEVIEELYDSFSSDVKDSEFGRNIERFLTLSHDLEIGDPAIDFTLPDLDGNSYSLSDFRGKYVLLGFWGSGCGGCVMEIPTLVKNYEKFQEKEFEIVNVFLDRNRDSWKRTVENYNMTWRTLSDLQGFDGDIPMTYKVQYVPKMYLLDKEGVIIAEDLRGEELSTRLEEIFNSESDLVHADL